MAKVYRSSIPAFLHHGFELETATQRVAHHIQRNQVFYLRAGVILASCVIGADIEAHASIGTDVIDHKAHKIYGRLCSVGKWIIVIRGGTDIIASMTNGDLDSMKKKIIGYLVGYAALLGLPWLLDQATLLFDDSGKV